MDAVEFTTQLRADNVLVVPADVAASVRLEAVSKPKVGAYDSASSWFCKF
jgi:hypothetical protein